MSFARHHFNEPSLGGDARLGKFLGSVSSIGATVSPTWIAKGQLLPLEIGLCFVIIVACIVCFCFWLRRRRRARETPAATPFSPVGPFQELITANSSPSVTSDTENVGANVQSRSVLQGVPSPPPTDTYREAPGNQKRHSITMDVTHGRDSAVPLPKPPTEPTTFQEPGTPPLESFEELPQSNDRSKDYVSMNLVGARGSSSSAPSIQPPTATSSFNPDQEGPYSFDELTNSKGGCNDCVSKNVVEARGSDKTDLSIPLPVSPRLPPTDTQQGYMADPVVDDMQHDASDIQRSSNRKRTVDLIGDLETQKLPDEDCSPSRRRTVDLTHQVTQVFDDDLAAIATPSESPSFVYDDLSDVSTFKPS